MLAALQHARVLAQPGNLMLLTNYPVDLDQKLLHGFVWMGPCPIHSRLIDTNASEHYIWRVGNIDAKDADELGNGLPQGLERSSHQPTG